MNNRDIRRKFGQNYLSDPAIIFEMGQSISPNKGDNFLEIGHKVIFIYQIPNIENSVSTKIYNIFKISEDNLKNYLFRSKETSIAFFLKTQCIRIKQSLRIYFVPLCSGTG